MANFSVNQVHQMYIVNACKTSNAGVQSDFANAGDVQVKKSAENELYLLYKGADGTIMKSDFIPLTNIAYAKTIDAADNVIKMRKVELTLDSNVNSGNPVVGQDYVLGIDLPNFYMIGDNNNYYKDAAVHVTSSESTASAFYIAMMKALNAAFSREVDATPTSNPYLSFKIYDSYSSAEQDVTQLTDNTVATKLIVEEKPQEWQLGTKKARRVLFNLEPKTVYTGGDDLIWGAVADGTPTTTIGNGQQVADLEWFCMGERGDQYRNAGWPLVIPTKYMVDATKQYHLIELHYFFTDSGVNSYKTEKEITIAVPKGESTANYTEVNKVVAAINYFAGTTILNTLS